MSSVRRCSGRINTTTGPYRCGPCCDLAEDLAGVNVSEDDPLAPDPDVFDGHDHVDLCIAACPQGQMAVVFKHVVPSMLGRFPGLIMVIVPNAFKEFEFPTEYRNHNVMTPLPGTKRPPAGLEKKVDLLVDVLDGPHPPKVVVIPALTAARNPAEWLRVNPDAVLLPATETKAFGEYLRSCDVPIVTYRRSDGESKPGWIHASDKSITVTINAMCPPADDSSDSSADSSAAASPAKPKPGIVGGVKPATPDRPPRKLAMTPERVKVFEAAAKALQDTSPKKSHTLPPPARGSPKKRHT